MSHKNLRKRTYSSIRSLMILILVPVIVCSLFNNCFVRNRFFRIALHYRLKVDFSLTTVNVFLLLLFIRLNAMHVRGGVGSTTTDRNKLTANNADWLRRAILKTFYYPQSHLAQTLYFVAKSLRRNGWFADSLFAVS